MSGLYDPDVSLIPCWVADASQLAMPRAKTSSNFVVELLRLAYAPVRKAIAGGKAEPGFAWKEIRAGAYRAVGAGVPAGGYFYRQEIIDFVIANASSLKAFVLHAFQNPTLIKIIDFIVQSAKWKP